LAKLARKVGLVELIELIELSLELSLEK